MRFKARKSNSSQGYERKIHTFLTRGRFYKPERRHACISMAREEFMALKPGEELLPSENRVGEKL